MVSIEPQELQAAINVTCVAMTDDVDFGTYGGICKTAWLASIKREPAGFRHGDTQCHD